MIATREELAAAPTGTEIRTARGDIWVVDHGQRGEWVGGRTHIYLMQPDGTPDRDRVFYPANFDLSLPVMVISRNATEDTNA